MITVYKLELVGFDDLERRRELYRLADDCQQIVNRIWQLWESWHVQNDSRRIIIAHLEADRLWREQKEGDRPKWPIDCLPRLPGRKNRKGQQRSLRSVIEEDISQTFPQVHSRVRTLLANITFKKITSSSAASGKLKAWVAILLNRQSRPSATHVLPIPFDAQHSKVLPRDDGDSSLLVRLDRPGDRRQSPYEEFVLRTSGRAARYVKPIARLAGGAWTYKGSSLRYDPHRRKWFAEICCEIPGASERPEPVAGRVAFLRCGHGRPVQLRIDGVRRFLRGFGRGDCVGVVRRQLLTQRWSRQENYRNAGSSNKGHGLRRALAPVFLLSRRWKDFVKRYNHGLTAAVIERCLDAGVETLVFFQPSGGRFLSEAGKVPGRRDSTGWDFHQISTFLAYKGERKGLKIRIEKSGTSRGEKSCAAVR